MNRCKTQTHQKCPCTSDDYHLVLVIHLDRWLACSTYTGNSWITSMKAVHHSQRHGRDSPHLTGTAALQHTDCSRRARLVSSPGANSSALQENLLVRPRRLLFLPKVHVFSFCPPVCYSFIQVNTKISKVMPKILQQPFQRLQNQE